MLCPYLLISINELLISIISFNDINKYGLNVKTAAHRKRHAIRSFLSNKCYRKRGIQDRMNIKKCDADFEVEYVN